MEKRRKDGVESKLGEEIIFQEILPRLPVKSIFRFKSVCKKWCNLFTHDPLFRAHHSQKGHNNITRSGGLMFCSESALFISSDDHSCHQFKWSKPKVMLTRHATVHGSTNGLFYGMSSHFKEIFIVNPLTNDTICIPYHPKGLHSIALASDPCNPNFGYTIVSRAHENDYDDLGLVKFQVYSSKTHKWRASKINNSELRVPSSYKLLRDAQAVFTGGSKVYWSVVKHILWFDFEKDVAGFIKCPHHNNLVFADPIFYRDYTEIGVCDGELSYSKKTKEEEIEIWLLRDNEKSNGGFEWVIKYKVSLQAIFEENWDVMLKFRRNIEMQLRDRKESAKVFSRRSRYAYPMPYSGGDHMWFTINNLVCDGALFLFNLRTRELKLIRDGVFVKYPFFPFMPSLHPCPR